LSEYGQQIISLPGCRVSFGEDSILFKLIPIFFQFLLPPEWPWQKIHIASQKCKKKKENEQSTHVSNPHFIHS